MSDEIQKPKVGVAVLIIKEGKILLGKRIGKHALGTYGFPGGKLEYMESFEECLKRETFEETGIEIENIKFSFVTNLTAYPPSHFVHLGFTADLKSGEPKVCEPDKFESWDWYDLDNLPSPLFTGCDVSINCYKKNIHYVPEIK
ncbi:MAG TPA: NUDIX domain-containing protein [Candidatus Paceibacterota bacterium]|jgi:8-oxo-dGTP diphosphatase|nr:NUDIX domain-containing protein [Candidatus Paceibacterota bacterium]